MIRYLRSTYLYGDLVIKDRIGIIPWSATDVGAGKAPDGDFKTLREPFQCGHVGTATLLQ